MWKPIQIKPGDQSLAGRKIRRKEYAVNDPLLILCVGKQKVFALDLVHGSEEYAYDFEGDWTWEIWEEPTHWVPKEGEVVWYLSGMEGRVTETIAQEWNTKGTCYCVYRTREHAELAAKYVKEAHAKAHEEIGE